MDRCVQRDILNKLKYHSLSIIYSNNLSNFAMLLDKYPNCAGCPVIKYCGTMVASTLLCATDNIGVVTAKSVHK